MAKSGEIFTGLDGKNYTLSSDDLIIVDEKQILALAGIMGGQSSGTNENTRHIYVESASFDPITIRKTSQRLGIRTDSSMRFEKGVDKTLPHLAQKRYIDLLSAFIPDIKHEKQTVITSSVTPSVIELTHDMLTRKVGTQIAEADAIDILERLGFEAHIVKGVYSVSVPSWRDTGDITLPEDIVEEVARHTGYDAIPSVLLPGPL
jgi:phenylalanyl-tRNA synthetase beta chain